jgi:cyclopropane-fatty-acyl-phospholipid synthase
LYSCLPGSGSDRKTPVRLRVRSALALPRLTDGQIGSLGTAIVEGWVEVKGSSATSWMPRPGCCAAIPQAAARGWTSAVSKRSMAMHTLTRDAEQIQFHYDLSDDFYALWLDPRRVYSCAYYREQG